MHAPSAGLIRYDAACRALAQAKATDEVLKLRTQAAMLRAYAKQAKNRDLEIDAAEIRIRAERRVGELMHAQRETVGFAKGSKSQLRGRDSSGGTRKDPPENPKPPTLAEAGIDKHLAERARKLAALPAPKFETAIADWREGQTQNAASVSSSLARSGKPHVAHHSGNNEWYTPSEYIEAARAVMNDGIDLDPATCEEANDIVQAARIFTVENDGLKQEWSGRVWLNPPYLPSLVEQFARKLVAHEKAGDLEAAIVLVNNATDTKWFHILASAAEAICFKTGRIRFRTPGRETATPLQGQVFLYFGTERNVFLREFSRFGVVFLKPRCEDARCEDGQ